MSEFKFSNNLFLEKIELDRWKKFITTDGYKAFLLDNSDSFGLIRKENEVFVNGLVEEDTGLTIKIREIQAINNDANLIYSKALSQIEVPNDSLWYWVKIAYTTSTEETGTFSVDSSGNLVCTSGDAELLTILRGQPNYPSRIMFTNATNNVLEYDVEDVIDNNNAVLTGSFTAESDLKIAIVGTFTPGYVPLTSEKFPFQYDSCTVTLVQYNLKDPAPTHTSGEEFFLARVKNTGSVILIEDKRNEIWTTNSNYFLHNLELLGNPLIGVEQITYDDPLSAKIENLIQVAWNFRSSTFTVNPKLSKITLTTGNGGKFKTPAYFTDGDFDGWRLYTESGAYYKVNTSSKVAGTIELILEQFDASDFFSDAASTIQIAQQLLVTPNVEEVTIICTPDPDATNGIVDKRLTFPVNMAYVKIRLNVYAATGTLYNVKYQYKHIKDYSAELLLPDDPVGYYAEDQFDSNGIFTGSTQTPYTADTVDGYIPLALNINAYSNFVDRIDLGDLLGVETSLLSNGIPLVELTVGEDRQYQYFSDGDDDPLNDDITLSADMFISLLKTNVDGDPCRNGNFFLLHFKQKVILNGFALRIVTDYVNPTTYTELKLFTALDERFLVSSEEGLFIRATFNDNDEWIVNSTNEIKISETKERDSVFSSPASYTLIPSMTYTSPADGKTRRFLFQYKGFGSATGNQFIGGLLRMRNTTSSTTLDYTGHFINANGVNPIVMHSTAVLTKLVDLAPGSTIEIQVEAYPLGGVDMSYNKFSIIEL